LQALAVQQGYVSSFVVVSPEMPFGNGHLVLKAIAERAQAPGRIGTALRALTNDLSTNSAAFAGLRRNVVPIAADARPPRPRAVRGRPAGESLDALLAGHEGGPLAHLGNGQHAALAYVGASLPLIVLFNAGGQDPLLTASGEIVAVQIVKAVVGSIGIVAAVPATTAMAVLLVGRPRELLDRRQKPPGWA